MAFSLCFLWVISWGSWIQWLIGISLTVIVIFFACSQWRRGRRQERTEQKRREQLKDPCEVRFLIPMLNEHKIDYYPQTNEYQYLNELSLPSNSTKEIVVWLKPKLDVVFSSLWFGCVGDIESKPEPLYYRIWWVKEGNLRKEIHPEYDRDHYVDTTNIYHISYDGKAYPKDECHLVGLVIKTKDRGNYPFHVGIIMPEGKATYDQLLLRVV